MEAERKTYMHGGGILEYYLRVSARARHMQLNVTSWGRVEVVLPQRMNVERVAPFVRKHQGWLERTLAKARALRAAQPSLSATAPQTVRLAALAEEWEVVYVSGPHARLRAHCHDHGRRVLNVEAAQGAAAHEPLQRWLHEAARQHLPPWLQAVSAECRLPYTRATVRAQKTRWGSCSARGHISLNRNLLFLPPPLVRYVLIHELCHTVHHNHSRRYWSLVSRHAPYYAVHEAALRGAACYIPLWASAE